MDICRNIDVEGLSADDVVLVAVSGGPDSVVLLDVLCTLGYKCVVAHCNFHLRGDDSDADALFVEQLAASYGIPFCRADFDTINEAEIRGVSVEMAARDLRYEWFEVMADKYDCAAIAVAHNANDAVETFFLNLIRGTGLSGLTGIAKRRGRIIRPILGLSRDDIMRYIREHGLEYRIDCTNAETVYRRNKIRHEILPVFTSINPAFLTTMCDNMAHLSDASDIVSWYVNEVKAKCLRTDDRGFDVIDVVKARSNTGYNLLMYEWLKEYGFSPSQIEQITKSVSGESGRRFTSSSTVAVINRNTIELHSLDNVEKEESYTIPIDTGEVSEPLHLKFETVGIDKLEIERESDIAYFDLDKIGTSVLLLRRWRNGDWMVPFGMNGKKKVSDILTEKKYSVESKRHVWLLLEDDEHVLWTIGVRADNRYRVSENTKRVLKVSCCR